MVEGFGLGLRPVHYAELAEGSPAIDWLEILSENYLVPGGKPLEFLDRIRARYPVVMHGVAMSIAGTDPIDRAYLRSLRQLMERAQPAWVSDHLCWTGVEDDRLHDLMPIPFTADSLRHVADRVHQVQEFLRRPLVLENVSSYLRFDEDEMSEWEFLGALVARTGCELLLDVNNVYVNSMNHGFDPIRFVEGLPSGCVRQIHLAGHTRQGGMLVDTHDAPVAPPVWSLYERTIERLGPIPTMIERDDRIPSLAELCDELRIARGICERLAGKEAHRALAA